MRQTATLVRQLPAIRAAPFHKSYITVRGYGSWLDWSCSNSWLAGGSHKRVPHTASAYAVLMRDKTHIRVHAMQDINDTTLCVLMSSITKGCDALNDVVDKVNTAYDKAARRRGGML